MHESIFFLLFYAVILVDLLNQFVLLLCLYVCQSAGACRLRDL